MITPAVIMPLLFGAQESQIVLLIGVGLFAVAMIARMRRNFARGIHQDRLARGTSERVRINHALKPPEQESWEAEMVSLARRLKGEIDTRMQALEQLIRLADDAHGRLTSSVGLPQAARSFDGQERASWRTNTMQTVADRTSFIEPKLDRKRTEMSPNMTAARNDWEEGDRLIDDPRFERVYALADAGFTAARIASHTGAQIGEVELILSLRGH